jgi:lysophosphatidate acyltransferase
LFYSYKGLHFIQLPSLFFIDIRVLTGHISAIAKKELMYAGPLGIAMYFGGMKFIDRSTREKAANDIKKFAEEIKEDEHKLWIFPEGKRFSDGKIHKFKHGAFNAAVHAEIPIIPIVISSYNNIIDFENKTFGKGEIIITVMPEVSTKGLASDDIPDLMEQVRDSMNEVYDKTSLK